MVITRRNFLTIAAGASIRFLRAAPAAAKWIDKHPPEWSPGDIQTILNHSAWVREAPLEIDKAGTGSPRKGKAAAAQYTEFTLLVRWESGLPVRLARRMGRRADDVADRYIISVGRVPLSFLGAHAGRKQGEELSQEEVASQLAATALIERGAKGIVRAENAVWTDSDFSPRVDISFRRSQNPIELADGDITVSGKISGLTFNARFALKPMIYRGYLEL